MDYAKKLEKAKQEKATAEGRLAAVQARLKETFGIDTVEEAEALLKSKYDEEQQISKRLEVAQHEFSVKYDQLLKDTGLA